MTHAAQAARCVRGRLQLLAERDDARRTVLTKRVHEGAFHLSKPYWDGQVLMVQWVNPTAGVFAGDVLESRVEVGPNAALLVTTPSATRVHTRISPEQPPGLQNQRFVVAEGAWLEVQPEWLIPHRGSAFRQNTEISVEAGGSLFYAELLAPGRTAHGEALQFEKLDLRFRLSVAGRLISQERLLARPDRLWALGTKDGSPLFIATVMIVMPTNAGRLTSLARQILLLQQNCKHGISALSADVLCLRLTSTSSIPLRNALRSLRHTLAEEIPAMRCEMRKI